MAPGSGQEWTGRDARRSREATLVVQVRMSGGWGAGGMHGREV